MTTWNTATGATSGDRLLNVGLAAIQVPTGPMWCLTYDPDLSDPNKVSLFIETHPGSATNYSISSTNFSVSGLPQALALCCDTSGNLYVVGQDNGSDTDTFGVQTFKKQSGSNIVNEQPYCKAGPDATEGQNLGGFAVVWCNTGGGTGGAGHLFIICDDAANNQYVCIMDAGKALAGNQSGLITKCIKNPAFLGAGIAAYGSNLDLSTDGFGATSGLAISPNGTTGVTIGAWGLTSGGALTTGGGLQHNTTCGTLSATTKCRIVRQSANLWVALFSSTGTPTQLSAQTFSSSALLGTLATLGTASNFPAKGATLSWDATAGSAVGVSEVWVFGFSSQAAHLDDLLRVPIVVTTPSTPSVGTVVTDNSSVSGGGASADMSTLRTVKEPFYTLTTDWMAYKSTSTYGLYGYYSALPAAPNVPLLTSPTSGSIVPLVASDLALAWTFSSGVVGDAQTLAYVRRQLSGAGYQWWTGAAWTVAQAGATGGSEVTVTGLTTAQSATTSTWVAADVYSYSVQTVGATGLLSGYASPVSFTIANTAPTTPTLTAAYGAGGNVTQLTFTSGDTNTTGSIEFSDDGVNWTFCRGATAVTCYPSAAIVMDWEAPAGQTRQYRARTWTGYPTSYSLYATANAFATISTFWLGDPVAGVKINIHIPKGTLKTQFPQAMTEHQGLGNPAAIVVGDVVGLEDGAFSCHTLSAADETALLGLLNKSSATLLLESPDLRRWYLRINSPRPTDTPYLVAPGTYRTHDLTFRGQNRP